jgi:hypothetical protein
LSCPSRYIINEDDDRGPGDDIPRFLVGVLPHQLLVADEEDHEDEDDRQDDPVDDLGYVHDGEEGDARDEDDAGAEEDEEGVEPVELGGLGKLLVDAGLPAHALADEEGRRKRQYRGGEQRGVEQAEGEQYFPASGARARAASAAVSTLIPALNKVAAQVRTMNPATTVTTTLPRMTSSREFL